MIYYLLLISNSGRTREILKLFDLVNTLGYNLNVAVITGNPDSELENLNIVTISTVNPKEVCPLGITPEYPSIRFF